VGLDKFLGRVKCGMRQKCRTGQKCRARQTCRVGQKCRAGQKCGLGQWCRAGQRCRVIQKCRAGQTCRVGQKCREGQNCKVGYECRARQKCRLCAREEQAQGDYTRISKSEKNTTSSRKLYTSVHWTTERFGDIGEKCRLFSPVMGTVSVFFFTVSAGDSDQCPLEIRISSVGHLAGHSVFMRIAVTRGVVIEVGFIFQVGCGILSV